MKQKFTRCFFIRHGEVETPGRFHGHNDVMPSPAGIAQMVQVAAELPEVGLVISSDLSRSVMGAACIAEKQGIPHVEFSELREMNFGNWENLSADQIEERFPERWLSFLNDIYTVRPQNGETFVETGKRVMTGLNTILKEHGGKRMALVLHGGVIRLILNSILKSPDIFKVSQDYAAITVIDYYENHAEIKLVNSRSASYL